MGGLQLKRHVWLTCNERGGWEFFADAMPAEIELMDNTPRHFIQYTEITFGWFW